MNFIVSITSGKAPDPAISKFHLNRAIIVRVSFRFRCTIWVCSYQWVISVAGGGLLEQARGAGSLACQHYSSAMAMDWLQVTFGAICFAFFCYKVCYDLPGNGNLGRFRIPNEGLLTALCSVVAVRLWTIRSTTFCQASFLFITIYWSPILKYWYSGTYFSFLCGIVNKVWVAILSHCLSLWTETPLFHVNGVHVRIPYVMALLYPVAMWMLLFLWLAPALGLTCCHWTSPRLGDHGLSIIRYESLFLEW